MGLISNRLTLNQLMCKMLTFEYSDLRFTKINDANILSCANVKGLDIEIIADFGTTQSSSGEIED